MIFPPAPPAAQGNRGKEKLHKLVKDWAQLLCEQLGYEDVVSNPEKYYLEENVRTEFKNLGLLQEGSGLYRDLDLLEKAQIKKAISQTLFRIDKVQERTDALESVFFGYTHGFVGVSHASKPREYQVMNNGTTYGVLHGKFLPSHVWKFKTRTTGNDRATQKVGVFNKGIFNEPWDDSRPGDILKYVKAVYSEGLDRNTPGRTDLKELGQKWRQLWGVDPTSPFRDFIPDFVMKFNKGLDTSRAWNRLNQGTHAVQSGPENWFTFYAEAFEALKQYAEALGYFSQKCVDEQAQSIAASLPIALGLEYARVKKELEDPIHAAIRGPAIPDPDPVRNLSPFDFQCFLIENIVHLSDLRRDGSKGAPKYKNVSKLSTGNDPGTVLSRINHGGQTAQVRQLMSLCPEAYALLEPSIKIYRVDYAKDNPTKPIGEQELHIPNFIDKSDIDSLLGAQGGRAKGYGLQSFNWSLAGVQPAEVDNNITANMKFYFQSIQDLFQGQLAAGQKEASPLDLIISSRASAIVRQNKTGTSITAKPKNCGMLRNNINEEYEGANFRISARIGWNMPPNFASAFPSFGEKVGGTNKTKGTLLTEALRNTQMHLFLQQTRHLINFKEDGSIELDIQYQAALSGILKEERANILANDKTFFQEEIKGYQEKIEAEKNKPTDFALGGGTDSRAAARAADKDSRIEELLGEIETLEVQDRNFKYKKFLEKLYTKNKVYNIAVQPVELLIPPWKDMTPTQRAARAKRRLSPNEAERGFFNVDMESTSANNTFDTTLLEAVTKTSKDPTKEESELEKHAVNNAARFKNFSLNNDTIMIPYFYLGDLLDLILETLPGYEDGEKFLFFMSEIELLNPLLAFQVKNLAEVLCTDKLNDAKFIAALRNSDPLRFKNITKLQNIINIGDIPISLDAFNVWFKDNVIKKDRDNYYFLYFVKDVCSQLISNALRGDCFGNSLKFDIRFDAAKIEVRKHDSIKPGKRVTVNQLALRKAALSAKATSIKNIVPAMIIYSTDSKPKSRVGNLDADLKVGIYHHYVGSACSIVKSINFQREDQPYLREAKIQKQGALDATQLRELYSVNLELIGNTLYKNGQYIYVDPTMVMGDPTLSRLLGISGYYLVTSVDHSISDAGYDVKIRALQEGIDFDENSNAVSVQFLDSEMAITPSWTPQTISDEERDLIVGDAGDNAVSVVGAVAEELAAGEHDAKSWAELHSAGLERAKKLVSGDFTMQDWKDHASDSLEFGAKASGPTGAWVVKALKTAGSAHDKWKENAEKQDAAQDLIDAGVPDPGEG